MKQHGLFLRGFAALALVAATGWAGCGPTGENPCADKNCQLGTCDNSNGRCVNKSSCDVSDDCIAGYKCSSEGQCVPTQSCKSDSDCEPGVCRDGACVNPESCSENSDCLPRTYCSDQGTCAPDPCNEVQCPRGTCKRGTETCVSKDSCSEESEKFDCVSGESCADGTCVPNDSYCDNVTCERGSCSVQESDCVNPDQCQKDADCLAGHFCNGMEQCQPNLCEQQNIDCGDQGTCRPASGRCENPTSCNSSEDCLQRHICIQGTCRLQSAACGNAGGDGGCPGNQICNYDGKKRGASCKEPAVCETSIDCKKNRRCGGRACLSPEKCSNDRFEGNNKSGQATKFADEAPSGLLRASLCQGDTDIYRIDTTKLVDPSTTGELVVDVVVPLRDRGLGKVTLEVLDGNGMTFGTAHTGPLGADGRARVSKTIMSSGHGTYPVKVTSGKNTKKPGVDYRLSADVVPSDAVKACSGAQSVRPNQRISGTTQNAPSSGLGSSCTKARNPKNERIYSIQVDHPQELTFELTPQAKDANLSMSLRSRCVQRTSEVACVDAGGKGTKETMTRVLGPGTYYLIVEPAPGAKGGRFDLRINRILTTCAPSGNYCDADGNAFECTSDGGRFQKRECDNGCNRSRGRCIPPDGDVCGTAKTISPSNSQTRTLSLGQANNEYDVGGGECLGPTPTKTGGPELTYEVKVPSQKGVRFEASFANKVDGSMYLVEDCSQIANTCKTGVKDSTKKVDKEVLRYANSSSSSDETLYLVVDTASGQEVSTAQLKVNYTNIMCTPGDVQCTASSSVEVCGPYGINQSTIGSCTASCSMGACQGKVSLSGSLMDTCGATADVSPLARQSGGVKLTGTWGQFKNDIEADVCGSGAGTGISGFDTGDNETFYQLELQSGDKVDASVSTSGDPSIWLKTVSDCGTKNAKCMAGEESESGSASLTYTASGQETVVVVIDREGSTGSDSFTLDIEIK